VGTFLGVFFCYCLMDPVANAMEQRTKKQISVLECVRTVLVNHVAGKPTLLAVDAGRKCCRWIPNRHLRRSTAGLTK
jgi:chemotaxis protein MotA